MITPVFEVSQDDCFVIISVRIPYTKAAEVEVYCEDYEFKFYCKPYFLKLTLPGKIISTDQQSATHDVDTGIMNIKVCKTAPGEFFEDLDLLTKLLPKTKHRPHIPKIEVIGDSSQVDEDTPCDTFEEDFDWEIENSIEEFVLAKDARCGFANMYTCDVFRLKEETSEIIDVLEPEHKSPAIRTEERLQAETDYFSDDYYLDNLYNDEEIQEVLAFKPDWENLLTNTSHSTMEDRKQSIHFTSEEKERLRKLPNKEYLLEASEVKMALFGLVDILFAYAYNVRTTLGDNTVESAWTINKLSATLSCLEVFPSVKSAAKRCMRRSLSYALYRNWKLITTVLKDTISILSLGQKYVLKCFLETHELFYHSDPRYLLNDLYVTDYCVWIQGKNCRSKILYSLAESLKQIKITKEDMDLELVELEHAANLVVAEQENASNIS